MLLRKISSIAFPLLAFTAGALYLSGCHGHGGFCMRSSPEKRAEHITKRIAKELDLTDSQKSKLDKVKDDILARKGEFSSLHGGLKEVFLTQLRSGAVDQGTLNQGFEERETKMKELRGFLIVEFAEFHALLDAAQREKLATRLEEYCR